MNRKSEAAKRIKEAVTSAGGLERVAAKSGVPKDTLGNYTRGISEPKATTLVDIAEATGADLVWLATGEGAMAGAARPAGLADAGGADYAPPFDRELMLSTIVRAEQSLLQAGALTPELKARVIVEMYERDRRETPREDG